MSVYLGKYNELEVIRRVSIGCYLDGGEFGDVLLPARYVPENVEPGDCVKVFLYLDSEDRLIATTQQPRAQVGEFAFLPVVSSTEVGVFLDWGLDKDLLVPFREQKVRMHTGRSYIVYLYVDPLSQRIVASSRFRRFLSKDATDFQIGEKVGLLITHQTDLGWNAIIENAFEGMLYFNELYQRLSPGLSVDGYIKRIRPDGKIDLSLQPIGYQKVESLAERVYEQLQSSGGFLPYSDKSPAGAIKAAFDCSKRDYKMAIGRLYRERRIKIEGIGIRLIKD